LEALEDLLGRELAADAEQRRVVEESDDIVRDLGRELAFRRVSDK